MHIRALLFDKVFIKISTKYFIYSNIFLIKNVIKFPENTGINEYPIKLEEGKQPSFESLYNLGPIELRILKTYIKTHLTNNFIQLSKSLVNIPILFN